MLDSSAFGEYCKRNQLSTSALAYVEAVRNGPPSRRVGDDARRNVCGRMPSLLVGQTVQFESRTVEAIFFFESELFGDNLEIWDQPASLQLRRDKGTRGTHVSAYTADYLLLPKLGKPTLVQCKTQGDLDRLIADRPNDWAYVEGKPQFLPAVEAAEKIGLTHQVYVTGDWASIYLANLEFLHALRRHGPETRDVQLDGVRSKLAKTPLTIFGLCNAIRDLEPARIYRWLANGDLFGALKAQLLSQEDVFRLFASADDAAVFESESLSALRASPEICDTELAAILRATPKELAHAMSLREKFQEVVEGQRKPTRNEYRYIRKFESLSAANGHTAAAFLPKFSDRGNTRSRLLPEQESIVTEKINKRIKTGQPRTISGLTGEINKECDKAGAPKVSCESVRLRFVNVKKKDVAEGELGIRGYHSALRPVSAKHATLRSEIPGLIAHVDSTQFDDRVWAESPISQFLECPWVYVIYDEACSRTQGAWLGFGKSDRFALALAIRDAARRQGCLPPYFFSDRGSEYGSIWYQKLLAQKNISEYLRPAGAPRFGGLQESCLKQINYQLAHRLAGSTWADQRGRSASGKKKSRATARLAFQLVVHETHQFLFPDWNNDRHGIADATSNNLWDQGLAQFGDVGRPVKHDDLAFLIATSIPVEATLGERKGIRVAYREYWDDELDAIRKPFRLDEVRLDPASPTVLYVKVRDEWFVTKARDHSAVQILTPEGRFLENYRVRRNAAATRSDGRSAKERLARRVEQLEVSNAAISTPVAPKQEDKPPVAASSKTVDLNDYQDIPSLKPLEKE